MRRIAYLFLGFVLASCGGGGGGGSSLQSSPAPAALVPITAGNANSTASFTLTALDAATVVSDFGLNLTFTVVQPLDAAGGTAAARLGFGARRMRAAAVSASGPSVNAVDPPLDCLVTGTVVVTSTIATPGTLTPNDTISTAFSNCDDGDGLILDGAVDLRVASFTGDLASGFFVLTTNAGLNQLLLTADGQSVLFDGDVSLDIDTSSDTVLTVTVAGTTLDVEVNLSPSTLSDFSITVDTDISNDLNWVETSTAGGTLTATDLGGKVNFETDPFDPLVQQEVQEFPQSGTIEILGAAGSSVLVSDSIGDTVTLDVDSDGDGIYETTIPTTWPELLP